MPLLLVLLAALVALPARALSAERVLLRADAGLGGLVRPGRWTPVRVALENASEDINGELVVAWGSAQVRRAVSLPSASRKQFELAIRTSDVRDALTVGLWSNGREIASVEAPVRVARADEPVTLCVAAISTVSAGGTACTVTVTSATLPRSWRGYDAIDDVVWASAEAEGLTRDQQLALRRWRAIRDAEESDSVSLLPLSALTGSRDQSGWLIAYVAALAVAGLAAQNVKTRSLIVYAAILLVIGLGTAAALAAGRVGPGAAVVIRHTAVVHQFDTGESFVSMRASAEYPAFDTFELRGLLSDGVIEIPPARSGPGRTYIDDSGYPVIAGRFGMGARMSFELDGITEFRALDASRSGRVTRVSNISRVNLHDCQFSEGFSVARVGSLEPGQSIQAEQIRDFARPTFSCAVPASAVSFTEPRYPVIAEGASQLIYRLPPGPKGPGLRK